MKNNKTRQERRKKARKQETLEIEKGDGLMKNGTRKGKKEERKRKRRNKDRNKKKGK